ncbi:hypothetical protein I553_8363 [Mycobacterium xenopi 4042]|uniref:Uncharacterized protein n=1 Tax=Mycobacterium xenopi 4042 TaxID=1299334 RepID=X8BJH5_MYCXE|nr:hypothetical protein I553_8363 [Mycobacterium xenopi 4042]
MYRRTLTFGPDQRRLRPPPSGGWPTSTFVRVATADPDGTNSPRGLVTVRAHDRLKTRPTGLETRDTTPDDVDAF